MLRELVPEASRGCFFSISALGWGIEWADGGEDWLGPEPSSSLCHTHPEATSGGG